MPNNTMLLKLQSFVGYEKEFSDNQPIEDGMIKRFAEAIGGDNPLYYDREFAQNSPFGGIIAPPTFVFEWNHHEALTDITLPGGLIRAGNEFEFVQPLRAGDIITSKSRISDVYEKQGRSGTMIFLVCQSTYTNQKDEVLGIQRSSSIVYPNLE